MEDKKAWVEEISKLFKRDKGTCIEEITYDKRNVALELVTIIYTDGEAATINVTGNGYGAILEEITREVYGGGAYARIEPWERWW